MGKWLFHISIWSPFLLDIVQISGETSFSSWLWGAEQSWPQQCWLNEWVDRNSCPVPFRQEGWHVSGQWVALSPPSAWSQTALQREARQRTGSDAMEDCPLPPLQLALFTALSPPEAFAAFPSSSRSFFVHFSFVPPPFPANFEKYKTLNLFGRCGGFQS